MFWLIQRVAGVSLLRREERAAWRERKRLEEGLYNARTDRASDTTPADRKKQPCSNISFMKYFPGALDANKYLLVLPDYIPVYMVSIICG